MDLSQAFFKNGGKESSSPRPSIKDYNAIWNEFGNKMNNDGGGNNNNIAT